MNFWRGNPNHSGNPAAVNVAGAETRAINGRLGFTVDDSNVYGILPKKQNLYEDNGTNISNNVYESYGEQTREIPRGRQAEADSLRRMFARAEYKFAQGRGPQLGISVSMPNASKRHTAIQGGISTSTISPMMGMGFQDGVGDESRRQDPLAKASRRVTMARGTSPSRTSPSRSLKRATIKHIPGSGMAKGHTKKRNTIYAKRGTRVNPEIQSGSPDGRRQTRRVQVAFAHQPLLGQSKHNAWGAKQRSMRSPLHSSPLQDILKLDAHKMTEDMRKRPTFKQPTNFFGSSAPASSWTMSS